ncbi:hypothetical protein ScPMuIL_014990 [Solemya velum]
MDEEYGKIWPSEYYAADALACDNCTWIVYKVGETEEDISSWLQKYAPSKTYRDDGIGWISIESDKFYSPHRDVIGLQDSWEKLQQSGRPISITTITELAKMHNVTDGKWLFYVDTGLKVDHLWTLVSTGIANGTLNASSAKVSTVNDLSGDTEHVICIYNTDFTDLSQVEGLNQEIRRIGIKCMLQYKPDVYTLIGIYRNNQWGLRPTIYQSSFDIGTGQSNVSQLS